MMLLAAEPQIPITDTIFVDAPGKYLPPRPAKSLVEVLPQRVIDAIVNADSIECVLLCPMWEHSGRPQCTSQASHPFLAQYGIRARRGDLADSQKAELLSILLDPKIYRVCQTPGDKSSCLCLNELAFLFTLVGSMPHWTETTAVIFCDCTFIIVKNSRNDIRIDLDDGSDKIVDFSRALFPEDSILADISRRRNK